jgi:hypothetical protein
MNANDHLMLMVAVVIAPRSTLSATHYTSASLRQTLTYYMSEGIIVEQFVAADGDYVLSRLATIDELAGRVRDVFSPVLAAVPAQQRLVFAADVFENAVARAKAGEPSALKQALTAVAPDALDRMADMIGRLRPVGRIEGAALNAQHLQAWSELAILSAPDAAIWLARHDNELNTIELVPASEYQFDQMLDSLLKVLSVDAI